MTELSANIASSPIRSFWRNVATVVFMPPAILLAFYFGYALSSLVVGAPLLALFFCKPGAIEGFWLLLLGGAMVLYSLLIISGGIVAWIRFRSRFRGFTRWAYFAFVAGAELAPFIVLATWGYVFLLFFITPE